MTLNVVGGQGVVSGTLTVNLGVSTGEILVFTTLATADYTALVTLSFVAAYSGGNDVTGGFVLPGSGGGGSAVGSAAASFGGGGVSLVYRAGSMSSWGAGATVRVGPGTAVKVPWALRGDTNSSGASALSYIINYHVAYIRNP